MTNTLSLRWGYGAAVPENATAVWGARMIARGYEPVDMLSDRQDADGPEIDALLSRLNAGLIRQAKAHIDELRTSVWYDTEGEGHYIGRDIMRGDQDEAFVLHDEDGLIVVANTQASYGYVYVVAFLTPKET